MATRDLPDAAVTALTRPGAGSALLAALGVYLVLVGQSILTTLAFIVTDPAYSQDPLTYIGLVIPAGLPVTLGAPVPFAIGVFLSFWQLAPVAPQLRMAHVVTRSLLAAVIGAALTFLVAVPAVLFVGLDGVLGNIPRALIEAVRLALPPALTILIQGLVVVPLAALLLWGRLQAHPPRTTPVGALDEV
ncbi:MAG TPA: hypothetical protein VNR36_04615 [Pseudolysinimonas sp.]|nr:hypothetical protein [Pseudolysinimonas sp.]